MKDDRSIVEIYKKRFEIETSNLNNLVFMSDNNDYKNIQERVVESEMKDKTE